MQYLDFCRLTAAQFAEVLIKYREKEERESREAWEIMRMNAYLTIAPHITKKIAPKKLLRYPWDEKTPEMEEENLTKAERMKLAQEALKKFGSKY